MELLRLRRPLTEQAGTATLLLLRGPGGPPEQDDAPAPATGSGDEGKSTQDVAMKAAPAPGTIAYHIKRMAELDEQYQARLAP